MAGKTEELIYAAFQLSTACPKEWEAFIGALDNYVGEAVKKLMSSEPATLSNFQGQAVQAQHIFHMLRDCRSTMQNAEKLRKAKPAVERTKWPSP